MKVPKGTSDYQATWIVDEDEEENEEMEEESSDDDDDDMLDEAMDGEDEENNSQVHSKIILGYCWSVFQTVERDALRVGQRT